MEIYYNLLNLPYHGKHIAKIVLLNPNSNSAKHAHWKGKFPIRSDKEETLFNISFYTTS